MSHYRNQAVSNTENRQDKTGAGGGGGGPRRPSNFDNPAYESTSIDDRSTSFLSPPSPKITVADSVFSTQRKSVITKGRVYLEIQMDLGTSPNWIKIIFLELQRLSK